MATTGTYGVAPWLPETTVVNVYPRSGWAPDAKIPGNAPVPAAIGGPYTVTNGVITPTGLTDGTTYEVGAQVGGVWTYVRFTTDKANTVAQDATVVHKAGAETITGAKTIVPSTDLTSLTITAPSGPAADQFVIKDADTNQIFKITAGGSSVGYRAGGLLYQLANIAPSTFKAATLQLYGTNGLGTGGQAWSIGVDVANGANNSAPERFRDFFLGKVTGSSTVSDELYGLADNGNGVVAWGLGYVPPPGDAKLSISPADSDLTQGGLRIRYNSSASGLPFRILASADARIRQAFNTKGGLYLSGDPNLQGAPSGVQFLAASPAASGTVDRSIWLSQAGQITTDALLELPSALTERVGLKIGTGGEPSYLQSGWDANQGLSLQHNAYYVGSTRTWATSHASFGTRAIEFGFGSGDGIRFYADSAATTGGSAATVTERMRIVNSGQVGINKVSGLGPGWAALNVVPAATGDLGIVIAQIASGTQNLLEWDDSSFATLGGVNKNGYIFTMKTAAPADAELAAGQLMFWFDKTNGAAKLMVKAKENGGTVRTGSVSLA